ncbi:MAG: hypothetical protein RL386_285 [Bacteroidota bacterium]
MSCVRGTVAAGGGRKVHNDGAGLHLPDGFFLYEHGGFGPPHLCGRDDYVCLTGPGLHLCPLPGEEFFGLGHGISAGRNIVTGAFYFHKFCPEAFDFFFCRPPGIEGFNLGPEPFCGSDGL